MSLMRILITDKVHPLLIEGFESRGFTVLYDTKVDNEILKDIISNFDGIVINSKIRMDRMMIDAGSKLQFIGRLGSGLEIIDVDYARQKGIKVHNSPEGNRNAVAEHTFGLMLALMNNIVRSDREVRNFDWQREKNRGIEIRNKTIGIIGMGQMGTAFAEKLSPWRLEVISYDKYRQRFPDELSYVQKVDLETLCEKSDIISLHLPLTDETRWMIDKSFLSKCKKGVYIINTSRGSVIKTEDLIEALESGIVAGAALDVFENEKPETYSIQEQKMYSKLFGLENVIFTPHIAGWTKESLEEIANVLLVKILSNLDQK
jgi:D-3-phosphoglycerate dehydrogenase / 2-oxoglutarate reductase